MCHEPFGHRMRQGRRDIGQVTAQDPFDGQYAHSTAV